MPHNGYDVFFPPPGKYETMHCQVCGSECSVERDCEGPISMASAMSGNKYKHDRFTCPHSGKTWHENAIELIKEFHNTKSKRLREIIKNDIHDELDEGIKDGLPTVFWEPDRW